MLSSPYLPSLNLLKIINCFWTVIKELIRHSPIRRGFATFPNAHYNSPMTDTHDDFTLTTAEAALLRQWFTYCPRCRAALEDREVYGKVRRVCPDCRFVQFIDPKVSTAVLAEVDGKVLLIRRRMEPARGSWCLPGGFIEMDETPIEAAIRECREETGLEVEIIGLVDVYTYRDYRGQGILIMYKGQVIGGKLESGDDAEKVGLFGPDELPENIAFETNVQALGVWQTAKRGERNKDA